MFGCLARLGCLALVLVLAIGGWFTRDLWYPRVFGALEVVEADAGAPVWQPVTTDASERGRQLVARLSATGGPAAVTLGPAEAAGYVLAGVLRDLPESASDLESTVIGDRLYLRANVALGQLGGDVLGPLGGMLAERETLVLGGTLEAVRPGLGQFRVAEVKVREFSLPSRAIPRLLRQLRGTRPLPEGIAEDGIPIELPAGVSDVRVARGQVTLYEEAAGDDSGR
jgi:hypothetical protein